LAVKLVQQPLPARVVLVANRKLMEQTAERLGLPLPLVNFRPSAEPDGRTACLDVPLVQAAEPGQLNPANAGYVVETLQRAVDGCLRNQFAALVTGPVHKGVINDGGIAFTGHTEFLARCTNSSQVVMLLVADTLRVALVTTHLPLARVAEEITRQRLDEILRILNQELRHKFGIAKPRIAVCGLNPHAGEGGHLGREEIETIEPAIKSLNAQGFDLIGPLPADTAFTPAILKSVDAVLAMYHDQGLPVLKHSGFGSAINVTLGLPIVRTSVDHGTALDLAGKGQADCGSLEAAFDLAVTLVSDQ
jgi:4-hydroxythreonine-4-phosphate dehydrogenase